jgi:hypothetical protein
MNTATGAAKDDMTATASIDGCPVSKANPYRSGEDLLAPLARSRAHSQSDLDAVLFRNCAVLLRDARYLLLQ